MKTIIQYLAISVIISGITLPVLAQYGTIKGVIKDSENNELSGARIEIPAIKIGTVSRDGSFVLKNVPVGKHLIIAKSLGYVPDSIYVSVKKDEEQNIRFQLKSSKVRTDEVEVTALRRRQEQTDTRPSLITISPKEAKFKAGAAEDVLRSLQTLPGVIAPNDFSSQLVIRGSGPDQNLIMIDNIEVFNPYRLYGFVSMFNPETVSDISLLTGGFPAKYSDRLSAVLEVTNREGTRDRYFGGKINASLTNVNAVLEGSLGFWNGSWLLSARRTYYDLIAGPIARSTGAVDGDVALPNFGDVQMKIALQPSEYHKITLTGIVSRDNTEFTSGAKRERPDSLEIKDESNNNVIGATWLWTPSDKFLSKNTISYYENKGANTFGGSGGSQFTTGIDDISREDYERIADSLRNAGIEVPALFTIDGESAFSFRKTTFRSDNLWRVSPTHTIEFGGQFDDITTAVEFRINLDPRLKAIRDNNPNAPFFPDEFITEVKFPRFGGYLQDNIRLNNQLTITPGVRYDYFGIISKGYITPRLSASYAFDDKSTLRASWGQYVQSPGYEKLFDRSVFLDLTTEATTQLAAEEATHYIIGFEKMLTDEWQFRAEAYYKDFNNLILPQTVRGTRYVVERVPGADPTKREGWTTPVLIEDDSLTAIPINSATGSAYGVEFLIQKVQSVGENTLYGWISYSLAWANRFRDGFTIPFNFDRRHAINIVGGWKFADNWDLNFTWVYGSGFPWTGAQEISPRVTMVKNPTTGEMVPEIEKDWRGNLIFQVDRGGLENINGIRLPDYHRLDIRFTTYANWFNLRWSWYLDVINVYNRANIIAENYRVDRETMELETRQTSMLPILPTLGFSVEF